MAEYGGVDRAGVGEAELASGFAGLGGEVFEAGGRGELQDVQRLVWEKLVCNVAFSGTCTVLRWPIREVLGDENAWSIAAGCASEAFAVGRAAGVGFDFDDPIAYVRDFGSKIPGAKPSMLLDFEAGRRLEIDFINGAIPRVGREVGVAAPVNETLTALVRALAR